MSGLAPITFECRACPIDTLFVESEMANNEPCVWLCTEDPEGRKQSAYLNEKDVRVLFNWLGVWLHTRC